MQSCLTMCQHSHMHKKTAALAESGHLSVDLIHCPFAKKCHCKFAATRCRYCTQQRLNQVPSACRLNGGEKEDQKYEKDRHFRGCTFLHLTKPFSLLFILIWFFWSAGYFENYKMKTLYKNTLRRS